MISCRRAAELTSLEVDTPLSFGQTVLLKIHRVICSMCRRHCRQLGEVDRAVGEFLQSESPKCGPELSDDARRRIKARLNDME